MSTSQAPVTETTTPAQEHKEHPTPRQYVNIALVLAVLTALEVSTFYIDFGLITVPLLIVLMVVKFVYVAGYFMHLKYDSKVFARLMYTGLFLALGLYTLASVVMLFDSATPV